MTKKLFRVLKDNNYWIVFFVFFQPHFIRAQNASGVSDSTASLSACISYAMEHQPLLRETQLNESISASNVKLALSGWFPQVTATANMEHYIQQPTVIFPDFTNPTGPKRKITTGVLNNSTATLGVTQNIYTTDLLFAGKTAPDYRLIASENTRKSKIDVVVDVSKAFYDVLLSEQQIKVLNEDVQRLEKNKTDAYNLFNNGVVDKTDYQRAVIALNNAQAQIKNAREAIHAKYAYLKQVMGYPSDSTLTIAFDSTAVAGEIAIDTLQQANPDNRVEYQQLQTNLKLQHDQVQYYKWSFMPDLSAFYNYNLVFQNDLFSELYNVKYPNSIIGLSLNLPIFQGMKRIQNLNIARYEYKQSQLQAEDLKNQIHTEYSQALAQYKGNLVQLNTDQENEKDARDIYNIITLQYKQGIKTYLDVIVAETDLRTAELNYLDALFQVLSSALDVRKALGTIAVQ